MARFTDEDLLDCINQMVGDELVKTILDDMHDNGETGADYDDFSLCFCPEEFYQGQIENYIAQWRKWTQDGKPGGEISLWDHLGVTDLLDIPGLMVVTDDRFHTYTTRTQFKELTGFDYNDPAVLVY